MSSWDNLNPPQPQPVAAPATVIIEDHVTPDSRLVLQECGDDPLNVLAEWAKLSENLEIIKAREMRYRNAAAQLLFANQQGTVRRPLNNGFQLKYERGWNYGFLKDEKTETLSYEFTTLELAIDQIEACGAEGALIAKRLVVWKPEFKVSEYNKLDLESANHRKIKETIDRVMTKKPATPTLEIIPPKDKK